MAESKADHSSLEKKDIEHADDRSGSEFSEEDIYSFHEKRAGRLVIEPA